MSQQAQGLLAINLAAIIFGSAALYGKLDLSPVWIVAMRAFFAFLILSLFAFIKGSLTWPRGKSTGLVILTGVILCIHWLTFFYSVQLSGVAIATLTFAAFPFFTILIETLSQKRVPTLIEVVSGAAILFAVRILVNVDLGTFEQMVGAFCGLASALAFSVFSVTSKKLSRSFSSIQLSLYQNAVVASVLFPVLPWSSHIPDQAQDWICLVLLGVVTTAIMHQLYLFALQRLSATLCSGFVALEPIYAIFFAAVFFKEPVTPVVGISCALIFGASLLLLKKQKPQEDFCPS